MTQDKKKIDNIDSQDVLASLLDSLVMQQFDSSIATQELIPSSRPFYEEVRTPVVNKQKNGLHLLLSSSINQQSNMDCLESVFQEWARQLTHTIHHFTNTNGEIIAQHRVTKEFAQVLNELPIPCLVSVFHLKDGDTIVPNPSQFPQGLLILDTRLVYSFVEVLFGAWHNSGLPLDKINRSYTNIEVSVLENIAKRFLQDFQSSLELLWGPCMVHFDRLEINPRFAQIAQGDTPCYAHRLQISMGNRGGEVMILLPELFIKMINKRLHIKTNDTEVDDFTTDDLPASSNKEIESVINENFCAQIRSNLDAIPFSIQGEFPPITWDLVDLLSWQKGRCVPLPFSSLAPIYLVVHNHVCFKGQIGQSDGQIAIKIDQDFLI